MPTDTPPESDKSPAPSRPKPGGIRQVLVKAFLWVFGLAAAAGASGVIIVAVALSVAYPNLPDI